MEKYRSNSHAMREVRTNSAPPEKKIEKVVSGTVTEKKKGNLQKIANLFVPEDVNDVKTYIINDVVVPAVKDILLDTVKTLLGAGGSSSGDRVSSRIKYRRYYDEDRDRKQYKRDSDVGRAYNYTEYTLQNRGEAEDVLRCMKDIIASYGIVSVADYYDLIGVDGEFTANRYGWSSLKNAYVDRVRGEYIIRFPKVMAIDID